MVYRRHVRDAGTPGLSVDGVYCALFDAGLTLAKIVLRSGGFRITGSHMSRALLLEQVAAILGASGTPFLEMLERGRRKRNRAVYDQEGTITMKEAHTMLEAITGFERLVRKWLAREHPELLPPELPL